MIDSVDISSGVEQWLSQLDLAQYTQTFVENDIQPQLLSELTDTDLRELGVTSLGHRKILLKAIAELKGLSEDEVAEAVTANARRLFRKLPAAAR